VAPQNGGPYGIPPFNTRIHIANSSFFRKHLRISTYKVFHFLSFSRGWTMYRHGVTMITNTISFLLFLRSCAPQVAAVEAPFELPSFNTSHLLPRSSMPPSFLPLYVVAYSNRFDRDFVNMAILAQNKGYMLNVRAAFPPALSPRIHPTKPQAAKSYEN
jgi:hypothetical protein